jgi:hypothetical protein
MWNEYCCGILADCIPNFALPRGFLSMIGLFVIGVSLYTSMVGDLWLFSSIANASSKSFRHQLTKCTEEFWKLRHTYLLPLLPCDLLFISTSSRSCLSQLTSCSNDPDMPPFLRHENYTCLRRFPFLLLLFLFWPHNRRATISPVTSEKLSQFEI